MGVLGTACTCPLGALPRVAVFGGRDYRDRSHVRTTLEQLLEHLGRFVLVHGACRCGPDDPEVGADRYARDWARDRGLPLDPYPADWDAYGRLAGPVRNRLMAESGLTGAVAFPGGRGTASMRRECDRAGVSVWER